MFAVKFATLAAVAAATVSAAPIQKRYTGMATFYNTGLGACGWSNGSNDFVVAIQSQMYGASGSRSQYCGQQITINYNGNSQTATVADECPTCGGSSDLDLSPGLFSALTGGNMGLGMVEVTWNWGSGSSSNVQSQAATSNNDKSNQQQQQQQSSSSSSSSSQEQQQQTSSSSQQEQATSSSSQQEQTPTSTSSASASTPTTTGEAKKQGDAPAPSGSASQTVSGVPQWWADVGTAGCDVTVPSNATTAALGPSDLVSANDLSSACGKWIEVTNPANNKSVKAVITTYLPAAEKNTVVLSDGYKAIAEMTGVVPAQIAKVQWGFVNGTTSSN